MIHTSIKPPFELEYDRKWEQGDREKVRLTEPLSGETGGQGIIYRGTVVEGKDSGSERAVKVVRGDIDEVMKNQFEKELRIAERIRPHYNVVEFFGSGNQPVVYLSMELVHGRSLRAILKEHGGIYPDPVEALKIGQQAAEGLNAINARVVHRDVKPENFIIKMPELRVVVVDLGVARSNLEGDRTQSTTMFGTPRYASPEQINPRLVPDGKVRKQADAWGLSVVLYEMLTGTRPFIGDSYMEIAANIMGHEGYEAPKLAHVFRQRPGFSTEFTSRYAGFMREMDSISGLIMRGLKRNWRERTDCAEISQELEVIIDKIRKYSDEDEPVGDVFSLPDISGESDGTTAARGEIPAIEIGGLEDDKGSRIPYQDTSARRRELFDAQIPAGQGTEPGIGADLAGDIKSSISRVYNFVKRHGFASALVAGAAVLASAGPVAWKNYGHLFAPTTRVEFSRNEDLKYVSASGWNRLEDGMVCGEGTFNLGSSRTSKLKEMRVVVPVGTRLNFGSYAAEQDGRELSIKHDNKETGRLEAEQRGKYAITLEYSGSGRFVISTGPENGGIYGSGEIETPSNIIIAPPAGLKGCIDSLKFKGSVF